MDGAYGALDRLRAAGAVGAIGVGLNEAEMCVRFAKAGDFDAMLLAGRYSLLEQPALDEFLPLAERERHRRDAGRGVQFGHPRDRPGSRRDLQLQAGAARHPGPRRADRAGLPRAWRALPDAALQFALAHPAVASVVLGAASPQEVARNLAG